MNTKSLMALLTAAALGACGGQQADDDTARDLSLMPAESVAAISDMPAEGTQPAAGAPATGTPAAPAAAATPRAATPAVPAVNRLEAPEGTVLALVANDTLTSRHNKRGETVTATLAADVKDARGRTVIPAGALVIGVITELAPAESPGGEGKMQITYNSLEFDGQTFAIGARTDSLPTYMKGRGVTGGDAAKVGAATAVGAAAGAIIGKNVKGAVIGGAVGAAAGVGIAAATRDVDILMNAGDPIRIVLTIPFERTLPN